MKAILVRIGIDHAYGAWNAPVHPVTGRFVYVPIPDGSKKTYSAGNAHGFDEIAAPLTKFAELYVARDLDYPVALRQRYMHLDPDFDHLTYGDNGTRRGARIATLGPNDLVVFYAGLRSILDPNELVYGLIGLFVGAHFLAGRSGRLSPGLLGAGGLLPVGRPVHMNICLHSPMVE